MLSFFVYNESHPRRFTLPAPTLSGSLKGFVALQFASPVLLSTDHCPPITAHYHPKLFRINTCKSVTKQTTSTIFRINTYEKHRGWGVLWLTNSLPPSTLRRCDVPTFTRVPDLSLFFSHSSELFCTFLHSRKIQLFCFQAIPHSLPKTPGGWGTPTDSLLASCGTAILGCALPPVTSHKSRLRRQW
jgi:hypothetical protein